MCRSDGSLILSDQQVSAYGALVDYLNEDGEGYDGTGLLAGAVCVFMWIITVANELDTVWNQIAAMYWNCARTQCAIDTKSSTHATHSSPRGHLAALGRFYLPISMHGTTLKHEDGKFRITSIGVPRLAFTVAGNVGRGVIASFLCYYGIRFVGYTLDLENLLMNAVALEFVVSVDERLFDALMPRAIKQFHARLQPFKLPPFTSYRGIDFRGVVALVVVMSVFTAALRALLIPQVGRRPHELAFVSRSFGALTPRTRPRLCGPHRWRISLKCAICSAPAIGISCLQWKDRAQSSSRIRRASPQTH